MQTAYTVGNLLREIAVAHYCGGRQKLALFPQGRHRGPHPEDPWRGKEYGVPSQSGLLLPSFR